MGARVRFAPSPTGRLHVGNARIALANWLFAKRAGGWFLLRFDDTDRERSTAEFDEGIEADLRWLGLTWDELARQSDRLERYDEAAERLKASGRLYACYETPEELALKRKLQLQRGAPPVYDRAALAVAGREGEAGSRRPEAPLALQALRRAQRLDRSGARAPGHRRGHQSDPVLVRDDGSFLYTLTSVVDDIDLAISHVIRGEDHVTNTGAQIELYQALGAEPPDFGHLPLLTDATGAGLSKRLGSLSLADLRAEGIEPLALASYLATVGAGAPELRTSLAALAADFDLARFGGGSPRFDPAELSHLNAQLLRQLSFAEVADRLPPGTSESLWLAVRGNIQRLGRCRDLAPDLRGAGGAGDRMPRFAAGAALLLPEEPWDEGTWGRWTAAVKQVTGRRAGPSSIPCAWR